ncbi:response regulator transcription factor [Paenibacillus pini]|uniref:Two component transcriptional regulator n=1 Tax=Paenibacillus pini JCM 16418 TaxID=1236976 RepID=W7YNY7_9BACL|nr:response regulator [Paenibacillus pini]GAF06406.1 two component transcriptional regulator [Paenibacillus pini JCM 16418]
MYRLMIVDDEPVIVNGLVHLFQENKEFELDVCKAFSSSEALEIAKRTKLDIIVSDIRMPKKNGLQLINEISYYWPSCRIILLTGYSEFEYVHEALRKNVDNYILKTEGIEPVFQAVKQAIGKLEEANRDRIQQERIERQFQIAESFLKQELFERMMNGEEIYALITESRYEEVFTRISLEQPAFLCIGHVSGGDKQQMKESLLSVQRIFDNYIPPTMRFEKLIRDDHTLVWLIQPGEELLSKFQEGETTSEKTIHELVVYMRGILELIQNESEELLNLCVSFGISRNLVNQWNSIHTQYKMLRSMIQSRALLGQDMVIVDIGKTSDAEEALYAGGKMHQEDMKSVVIEQIHRYIDQHLAGDVSLTAIAEEVHFNPSYLSRYYKQATAHNLLEYIQSKKLEGALHLMENTSLKLNEIAMRVGFDSHSYFTTFFKKKMGISPQEYRNSK